MEFTQIPTDTFKQLQLNAGVLCKSFVPATGVVTEIIGATTGGTKFTDKPTWKDFGEDIDNCPKNMMELKKVDSREVLMAGTFLTVTAEVAKMLMATADIDGTDTTKITPRDTVKSTDFSDLWFVGDYSDINDGTKAGFIAIHLLNGLNTDGFSLQSADKEKGKFAFNFMGHYSVADQTKVPYEIYVKAGAAV